MSSSSVSITSTLRVCIAWDNHFLTPFLRYCGVIAGPRPADITEHEAKAAYAELEPLEEELRTMISAYHARTGALPVVGDELCVSNYYNRVPTEVRIARRILFMPNTDVTVMEVIYYFDCDDIRDYR
jgi:hypothetical protein